MEHKHFVTFEKEIMSFPCYITELFYSFISKEELCILRVDREYIDHTVVNQNTVIFPKNPSWTNELDVLKTILGNVDILRKKVVWKN